MRKGKKKAKVQKQFSREFLRQWLIQHNFQGLEGQNAPLMDDDIVNLVSERYIELFEKITGKKFERAESSDILNRVEENVLAYLSTIN